MTEISNSDIVPTDDALMRQYGIERVPAERFHYKTFRYSTLADAVRQAQRDQRDA
jgi:hypothetical protein